MTLCTYSFSKTNESKFHKLEITRKMIQCDGGGGEAAQFLTYHLYDFHCEHGAGVEFFC